MWGEIMKKINGIKEKMKLDKIPMNLKKLKQKISNVINDSIKPLWNKILQWIKKSIGPVFHKVHESKIGKQTGKFFTSLGDKLQTVKEKIDFSDKKLYKNNMDYIIAGVVAVVMITSSAVYMKNNKTNYLIKESNKVVITDNKAEDFFYAGDYASAVNEYLSISKKDNGNPKWDIRIAEVYSVKGDFPNSKTYIQIAKNKIAKDKIKDGNLLNYMVFTEFMNKSYDDALKDGIEALKVAPKNKGLIRTMFTVYMANNQVDKAKDLIKGYPVNTKSAYDMTEYARMLMVINDWEQGLQVLKNAWEIDKDELKVYDVLAQISVYNRDLILEKVSNLSTKNPKDVVYKMWLAKIYSLTEETADQASKLLAEIKNEKIGKVEIKLIEVAVLQNTKQADKADALMSEIVQKNYKDYRVLHAASWHYYNKKDYAKALLYCKQSIVKNKDYPDNYGFLMPDILQAQGKSLEGEPYFRTGLMKEPYNYNIMLKLANYYWYTTQNTEKALEYFKFAEIVKPNDAEIKYNMACIYLNKQKQAEAVELLKQCIKLDDMTSKYHRTLGTIYMIQGKSAEGIKEIRYAYKADESDIQALNNAGCYYISVDGEIERGLTNFKAAVQGIKPTTDKYTSDTIKQNFEKAQKLNEQYKNSKGDETLKVPDFTLFY